MYCFLFTSEILILRIREDTQPSPPIRKPLTRDLVVPSQRESYYIESLANDNDIEADVSVILQSMNNNVDQLHELKNLILSEDPSIRFKATQRLRKILSAENPPIRATLDTQVLPRLIQFLQNAYNQPLHMEAVWVITNLCSGTSEETQEAISAGVIPALVASLKSSNDDVVEQAVWALSNIAGDSVECRDLVIGAGVIPHLIDLVNNPAHAYKYPFLRNIAWAVSNLSSGKPSLNLEACGQCLKILKFLLSFNDKEILSEALWGLGYISDGSDDHIDAVIAENILPRVIECFSNESASIQAPASRILENCMKHSDPTITSQIIQLNPSLQYLYHEDEDADEEAVAICEEGGGEWEEVENDNEES